IPCFCDSSFAAASAPVRADRNTGLVELFAIIAIFNPRPAGAVEPAGAGAAFSPPPHAAISPVIARVAASFMCIRVLPLLAFSLRVGPHPHALALGDSAPRSGRRRFSLRVGPHPHALALG